MKHELRSFVVCATSVLALFLTVPLAKSLHAWPAPPTPLLASALAGAAQPNGGRIAVRSAYPMAVMAGVLETQYDWIVTFEDAPIVDSSELVDNGARTAAGRRPSKSPRLATIDLPSGLPSLGAGRAQENVRAAFALVFAAHEEAGNAGRFDVVQRSESVFHIVPKEHRDSNGAWLRSPVPLDTPVSLSPVQRTAQETLQLVCEQVSARFGKRVWPAAYSMKLFISANVTIGAQNEIARDVLFRMLQQMPGRLTWRLSYMPFDDSYALSLYRPGADVSTGSIIDASGLRKP